MEKIQWLEDLYSQSFHCWQQNIGSVLLTRPMKWWNDWWKIQPTPLDSYIHGGSADIIAVTFSSSECGNRRITDALKFCSECNVHVNEYVNQGSYINWTSNWKLDWIYSAWRKLVHVNTPDWLNESSQRVYLQIKMYSLNVNFYIVPSKYI